MFPNWFVAGVNLPTGDISYHLPLWMWEMLDNCKITTTDNAPIWDGYTSEDVIKRFTDWLRN